MDFDPPVYGLDIETDTSRGGGLDPRRSPIVAVAVADGRTGRVFTGAEAFLLARLDEYLAELAPGVLATWYGSVFDLPFLAERAHRLRVGLGLRLTPDPQLAEGIQHPGPPRPAYRAAWHRHTHLDAYRLYRADLAPAVDVSCSLKSIARLVGLDPVEVDCTRIHDLRLDELASYVASDAQVTRDLVLRRWSTARRSVDEHSPLLRDAGGHRKVAVG